VSVTIQERSADMAAVSVESANVGRNFLYQWVLANVLGLTLALMSVAVIDRVGGDDGGVADGLSHIIGLALAGAVVGILQVLVLRRLVQGAAWGILASSVALPVGFILGFTLGGPPIDFFGSFVLLGLLSGITYWLVLRRQAQGAGWYVLASSGGWLLGGVAALLVAITLGDAVNAVIRDETLGFLAILSLLGIAGGLVGGTITGVALARLLQSPISSAR
jgi:hypothetical protein